MAAASIDIDKPGKYRIVLSDALLGKSSKDVYTGIRCKLSPLSALLTKLTVFKIITSQILHPIQLSAPYSFNPPTPTLRAMTSPSQITPKSTHTMACERQATGNTFSYLNLQINDLCCIE